MLGGDLGAILGAFGGQEATKRQPSERDANNDAQKVMREHARRGAMPLGTMNPPFPEAKLRTATVHYRAEGTVVDCQRFLQSP